MPVACQPIDQFHPSVREHDAVSNELLALQDIFRCLGFPSNIYSNERGELYGRKVERLSDYHPAGTGGRMLIHYSTGASIFHEVFALPVRKSLIYHNVTPPTYMADMGPKRLSAARRAREDLIRFARLAERTVAHSRFSAAELRDAAVKHLDVIPYTFFEPLYATAPDPDVLHRFSGTSHNLLFVGRVAPHKHLEDCLFVLDYLVRNIGSQWRLIVAGNTSEVVPYHLRLVEMAAKMGLHEVHFLGDVTQPALIACYRVATALVFLSDHEGFGVPLVEAMRFGVPVFAYAAGAVPEVLGDTGVLFTERNHALIAETIALVAHNPHYGERIVAQQLERYRQHYEQSIAEERWRAWVEKAFAPSSPMGS